ncbi:MAG: flagellar motor switch protein FliN [Gammaproteobacteria bacterium]|nr:flagellar motor switch protein FliN [Gammaproteobacteria bacterium]|tara:strand:+ start:944 stop:1315 length:372 start_codon:yes stop_codon:yes gene_type:complete
MSDENNSSETPEEQGEDVLLSQGKTDASESELIQNSIELDSDLVNNLPVNVSVEVGRTKFKIEDLMRLTQGSVVELDRLAGEPLDLLVNNVLVAQGEVVLVNDRYGIRLTQVVPKTERLKRMD